MTPESPTSCSSSRLTSWLALGVVAWLSVFVFSGFGLFAYLASWLPLSPTFYVSCACLLTLLLMAIAPDLRRNFLGQRALLWFGGYLLVSLAWYIFFPQSHESIEALKDHANMTLVFCCCLAAFQLPEAFRLGRTLIAWVVVISCFINMYAVFFPIENSTFGWRSAAFYINPNECAYALALGSLVGIGVVPERFRGLFLALVIPGVALTFSRSGALMLAVLLPGMLWAGLLKRRHLGLALLGCLAVLVSLLAVFIQLGELAGARARFFTTGFVERLSLVTNDASGQDRLTLLDKGWEYIHRAPWFGNGLDCIQNSASGEGPHVEYVALMMNYGVWAVILYPLLVLVIVPRNRLGLLALVALLGLGFFDHNLLDSLEMPLVYAALATLAATSAPRLRTEYRP